MGSTETRPSPMDWSLCPLWRARENLERLGASCGPSPVVTGSVRGISSGRSAIRPLVPVSLRLGIRRLRGQDATPLDHTVIKPEFARRMGVQDRLAANEREHGGPARSARDAHARAMASGLIPYALEVADKTAAAFGVEPVIPSSIAG